MKWKYYLLALFLSGCGLSQSTPPRQDPLIGKIYHQSGREMSADEITKSLPKYDVIYLGENHDNRQQHQLQIKLIKELIALGKKPTIAMEFFHQAQTPILMSYVKGKALKKPHQEKERFKKLRKQLGWKDVPDSYWEDYSAFIQLARDHNLNIFGADISRALAFRMTQVGRKGLTKLERELTPKTDFQNPAYEALMKEYFTAGHCGWSQPDLLDRLYGAWLARNQAMANAIVSMKSYNQPIVVIIGTGHAEYNMAVFERVQRLRPGYRQLNLGFREIARKPTPLKQYLQGIRVAGNRFPSKHEIFWFTDRSHWEDPCEKYKESLKKHQKGKKNE